MQFFVYFDSVFVSQEKKNERWVKRVMWRRKKGKIGIGTHTHAYTPHTHEHTHKHIHTKKHTPLTIYPHTHHTHKRHIHTQTTNTTHIHTNAHIHTYTHKCTHGEIQLPLPMFVCTVHALIWGKWRAKFMKSAVND